MNKRAAPSRPPHLDAKAGDGCAIAAHGEERDLQRVRGHGSGGEHLRRLRCSLRRADPVRHTRRTPLWPQLTGGSSSPAGARRTRRPRATRDTHVSPGTHVRRGTRKAAQAHTSESRTEARTNTSARTHTKSRSAKHERTHANKHCMHNVTGSQHACAAQGTPSLPHPPRHERRQTHREYTRRRAHANRLLPCPRHRMPAPPLSPPPYTPASTQRPAHTPLTRPAFATKSPAPDARPPHTHPSSCT
jgi:hypothetical protein